jgi:hypothetical protein
VSFDFSIWLAGVALEAVIIVLLLEKKIARLLPVFFIFSVWNFVSDIAGMIVQKNFASHFFHFFVIEISLDSLVQFAVLVELSWSILRPYRSTLPRATIFFIAALVLIAGAAVWPFTGTAGLHGLPVEWTRLIRLQQTFSALRILFFLALAALSQLLAIGWRNRELQVATGLGFFSLMNMGTSLIHTASPAQFHTVRTVVAACGVCSLIYWVFSFTQKEAARQEFTPRMQSLLLSVAGTARANRVAIKDLRKDRD